MKIVGQTVVICDTQSKQKKQKNVNEEGGTHASEKFPLHQFRVENYHLFCVTLTFSHDLSVSPYETVS